MTVTCNICGAEHAEPRWFNLGSAFEGNGKWWCRDARSCSLRVKRKREVEGGPSHG